MGTYTNPNSNIANDRTEPDPVHNDDGDNAGCKKDNQRGNDM